MANRRNTRNRPNNVSESENLDETASKKRRLEALEREARELRRDLEMELVSPSQTTSTPDRSVGSSLADTSTIEVLHGLVRGMAKKHPPLPTFSGDLDGFQYFYENYRATEAGIPAHENMKRLKEALQGDAYRLVSGYFDKPHCLAQLLTDLKAEYGAEVPVTREVLKKCEKLPKLDATLSNIQDFVMAIMTMRVTVEKSNSSVGELAVEMIQGKLDHNSLVDWGRYQLKRDNHSDSGLFTTFLTWLSGYKQAFQAGGGKRKFDGKRKGDDKENGSAREIDRRYGNRHNSRRDLSQREEEADWRTKSRNQNREFRDRSYDRDRQSPEQGRSRFDRFHRERHEERPGTWTMRRDQRPADRRVENAKKLMMAQQPTEICGLGCTDKNGRPERHSLAQCQKFPTLGFQEASAHVYKTKHCFQCLGKHMARHCPEKRSQK